MPVCGALAEAHRAGIVHRDIKPSNIFLHRQARREIPKVLDFGIARLAGEAALTGSLTVDGSLLGTPAYMAPERFSSQPYDGKSDVYSVGITLYQMLAGRLPFTTPHRDPLAMAMMQRDEEPPPLGDLDPPVPAGDGGGGAAGAAQGRGAAAPRRRAGAPDRPGGGATRTRGPGSSMGDAAGSPTPPTPVSQAAARWKARPWRASPPATGADRARRARGCRCVGMRV